MLRTSDSLQPGKVFHLWKELQQRFTLPCGSCVIGDQTQNLVFVVNESLESFRITWHCFDPEPPIDTDWLILVTIASGMPEPTILERSFCCYRLRRLF